MKIWSEGKVLKFSGGGLPINKEVKQALKVKAK